MSEQSMQALRKADEVRLPGVQVRREITCGVLTVAEALEDPRAGVVQIQRLLTSQPRVGLKRAHALLRPLHIWPTRRVRDLTAHQKAALVVALADAGERRERRAA